MLRLAVITGTRAEYGLLSPLIRKIEENESCKLQLFVTGAHLSQEFGYTVSEIISDGRKDYIPIQTTLGTTAIDVASSMAQILNRATEAFHKHQPDLVVVLGDRYEIMATVQAAMLLNIPIAHIHGGEVTRGAIDDQMRHCITKMSHLHFTASNAYRDRVIQLGEHPDTVFAFGSLGHENILKQPMMARTDLEKDIGFKFYEKNILVAYHPVTALTSNDYEIDNLLGAINKIGESIGVIFSGSNADVGGAEISSKFQKFAKDRSNCLFVNSFGMMKFLSVMNQVDGMVGNSSSGIIEAPLMGIWTLNIGARQAGRSRTESIVDSNADDNLTSILLDLLDGTHPATKCMKTQGWGDGNTSDSILKTIMSTDLSKLIPKLFWDL